MGFVCGKAVHELAVAEEMWVGLFSGVMAAHHLKL